MEVKSGAGEVRVAAGGNQHVVRVEEVGAAVKGAEAAVQVALVAWAVALAALAGEEETVVETADRKAADSQARAAG